MGMSEHLIATIIILIIVLVGLIVYVFVIQPIFGGESVRKIVCGALFWIPFGNVVRALTHGCSVIPA